MTRATHVALDHLWSEVEEDEVQRGCNAQADVGRERRQDCRSDHDGEPDAPREVFLREQLRMPARETGDEAALRGEALSVQRDGLSELGVQDLVRRTRGLTQKDVVLAGRHFDRNRSYRTQSGTPYESCSEMETAVPINTSTVEA